MSSEEIGGYLEFEKYNGKMMYNNAIKLNLGRNCLKYILLARKISHIFLPNYLCESIVNVCHELNVKVSFYDIDYNFYPCLNQIKNEVVYIINFFGQLDNNYLKKLSKSNLIIVDNVQAYFQKPIYGIDTLYSCRKFFGVPDGALLFTSKTIDFNLEVDSSLSRLEPTVGRFEFNANKFFSQSKNNEQLFDSEKLKYMSKYTENLLHSFDYSQIKKIRTRNFNYLNKELKSINKLKIKSVKGAFSYPLMVDNAQNLRKYLISNNIYIPLLWPNCLQLPNYSVGYKLANNILPLPCDQRYNKQHLDIILNLIKNEYKEQ